MIKVVEEDLETVLKGGKEPNSIEDDIEVSYLNFSRRRETYQQKAKNSGKNKKVSIDSIDKRFECVEKDIDELEILSKSFIYDNFLKKARQLTGEVCRLGATEAMRTCIAIQLVVRLHLISRLQLLIDELRFNVKSFKENLISNMA
jgi:hypothetical protein